VGEVFTGFGWEARM